jgi:hypothetical protein
MSFHLCFSGSVACMNVGSAKRTCSPVSKRRPSKCRTQRRSGTRWGNPIVWLFKRFSLSRPLGDFLGGFVGLLSVFLGAACQNGWRWAEHQGISNVLRSILITLVENGIVLDYPISDCHGYSPFILYLSCIVLTQVCLPHFLSINEAALPTKRFWELRCQMASDSIWSKWNWL